MFLANDYASLVALTPGAHFVEDVLVNTTISVCLLLKELARLVLSYLLMELPRVALLIALPLESFALRRRVELVLLKLDHLGPFVILPDHFVVAFPTRREGVDDVLLTVALARGLIVSSRANQREI